MSPYKVLPMSDYTVRSPLGVLRGACPHPVLNISAWGQAPGGVEKSYENLDAAREKVAFRVCTAWGQAPFRMGTGPLELRFFC